MSKRPTTTRKPCAGRRHYASHATARNHWRSKGHDIEPCECGGGYLLVPSEKLKQHRTEAKR